MKSSELFNFSFEELVQPTCNALKALGDSGSAREIEQRIAIDLNIGDAAASELHDQSVTKFSYRCSLARNFLENQGIIAVSKRGIWTIKDKKRARNVDLSAVNYVADIEISYKSPSATKDNIRDKLASDWKSQLLEHLLQLQPKAFENLCLRLLRELGFTNLELTGKPGDGGIDGVGTLVINEVISFDVLLQAKRFKGSVGSSVIRDFRGALSGRAEKGLIITTGTFTSSAIDEAVRQGSTKIDLIDGGQLCEKMANLGLGINKSTMTVYKIDYSFFDEF